MRSFLILFVAVLAVVPYGLAATLYINSSMSTCNDSFTYVQVQTWTTPWCSLTNLNNFSSGDTVYLATGNYSRESSAITIEDKVIAATTYIKAYPGNNPMLTAAMTEFRTVPNSRWGNRSDACTNCFETTSTYATSSGQFWFVDDLGTDTMSYGDGSGGTSNCAWTFSAFSDPTHPTGIWHNNSNDKYWIRPDHVFNPNTTSIFIAKNIGGILQLQNITGSAQLVIEGLNFSYGRYAITAVADGYEARNINISNNSFSHFFRPLEIDRGSNFTITRNRFYNKVQSDWFWQMYKADHHYATYGTYCYQMEGDAIKFDQNSDDNVTFTFNSINGNFNGIYMYATASGDTNNVYIYNNTFTNIGDDCVELENYAYNANVYNNVMNNCFVGVSLAPCNSNASLSRIYNNVIHCGRSEKYYSLVSNDTGQALKYERSTGQASNFYIHHNTWIGRQRANTGNAHPIANITSIFNIFYIPTAHTLMYWNGDYRDANLYDYNDYWRVDGSTIFQYYANVSDSDSFSWLSSAIASNQSRGFYDVHSIQANPQFISYTTGDYNLSPSSSACNIGGMGYAGALPCTLTNDTTKPVLVAASPTNGSTQSNFTGSMVFNFSETTICTTNNSLVDCSYGSDSRVVCEYWPSAGVLDLNMYCRDASYNWANFSYWLNIASVSASSSSCVGVYVPEGFQFIGNTSTIFTVGEAFCAQYIEIKQCLNIDGLHIYCGDPGEEISVDITGTGFIDDLDIFPGGGGATLKKYVEEKAKIKYNFLEALIALLSGPTPQVWHDLEFYLQFGVSDEHSIALNHAVHGEDMDQQWSQLLRSPSINGLIDFIEQFWQYMLVGERLDVMAQNQTSSISKA